MSRKLDMHRLFCLCSVLFAVVGAYHRKPCTRQAAAQFSFDDCYLPAMNPALALADASFVLAHDAATGYIQKNHLSPDGLTWSYTKTQTGTLYEQLQDGARALDLRPKLLHNGTIVFHHGVITVPISFQNALTDVIRWCQENPKEVVLLLTSHYSFGKARSSETNNHDDYYASDNDDDAPVDNNDDGDDFYSQTDNNAAMVNALQNIYNQYGVTYLSCADVYGWTIENVQEQANLPNGGILLALDGKDAYPGKFCGKENWIENQLVPCWTNGTSCKTSLVPYERLRDYILASVNNPQTDDNDQLGPPSTLVRYPLNEIQALWQVTGASAAIGLAHFSNILADNQASLLHEKLVDLIHQEGIPGSISLLAVDNVALHGNALTSVLRNRCGQSILNDVPCGPDLAPPRLHYVHLEAGVILPLLLSAYVMIMTYIFFRKRPYLVQTLRDGFHHFWKNLCFGGSLDPLEQDSKEETLIAQYPTNVAIT